MRYWFYIFLIAFIFLTNFAKAQVKKPVPTKRPLQTSTTEKAKLFGVAAVVKNNILLRWAPTTEQAWLALNKYGYVVERYTVTRDNKFLQKPERRTIKGLIKPLPLKDWDTTILIKDDYAAVIAQTLYGERLEMIMQDKDKGSIQSLVGTSTEKKQRFAMAMYAADHSFKAAQMAGLAWHDKNVKKNEKYLYRIYSPIPASELKIDTAKVFIGLEDEKSLPKPSEILPEPGDKNVNLAWEFDNFREYYGSYYVERSDDGGTSFHKIADRPVTKLTGTDEASSNGSIFYSDTLTNNETEYKYRIAGVTIFDEVGPYSDIVTVKGITKIETAPHITGAKNVADGKGILEWQVEDSVVKHFKYFELNSAVLAEGPYRVIKTNISTMERSVTLDSVSSDAAYLTLTAVAKEGENKVSMPYLLQAEDSMPPAIPQGLKGTIDSNGVVKLSWIDNTDKDIKGYKLYKSYVQGQELTPMIDTVCYNNNFSDTVQIKNLNSKIYYSIRAVDKRYNQSEYAPILVVTKPDVIPPTQPVFKEFNFEDTAVVINWINSYDADLMFTKLLKKNLSSDANEWELVKQFEKNKNTVYIDRTCKGGDSYAYTLVSIDSSNLSSAPALPLTVQIPKAFDKSAIKKLEIEVDRDKRNITLTWSIVTKQSVSQVELYRGTDKEKISLYKVLDANELTFVDDDLKINTKYQYGVRVVFEDGKTSEIKIKKTNY
jgi:uncharacterized protein